MTTNITPSDRSNHTTNVEDAIQFVYANARLLDRRRLEHFVGPSDPEPVVTALRPYQNPDGGFGNALEPDMRAPASEPSATLLALETLIEVGVTRHPMITEAADWVASSASPAGTLPQMMAASAGYPHAPFINPGGPTFLTFALAGALCHTDIRNAWLDQATDWCWREIESVQRPHTYTVEFALRFLDAAPDQERAVRAIDRLRPLLDADGCMPVPDGIEGEHVTPLELSPQLGSRSRILFTQNQIDANLDQLEQDQQDDGGWDFGFLHWSAGQALDWRGSFTVNNLRLLGQHGRIPL